MRGIGGIGGALRTEATAPQRVGDYSGWPDPQLVGGNAQKIKNKVILNLSSTLNSIQIFIKI